MHSNGRENDEKEKYKNRNSFRTTDSSAVNMCRKSNLCSHHPDGGKCDSQLSCGPGLPVTIPVDTSMQFNETETSYGNIVVEQAQIEDGKCIQVSLLSDLNLKNSNNSKAVIPYQILAQDEAGSRPFTSAQYTKAGEETPLTIAIKKEDWKKAAAGEYADTVTFTISYVDKSE